MKKVIYSLEQIQELVRVLNSMNITGIDNCKCMVMCTNIIDYPIEEIEEEQEVKNKEGE